MTSSVHSLSDNSEADEQQKQQTESHYQPLSPADEMPHPSIYGAHAQLGVGNVMVSGSDSKWDLIPRIQCLHPPPQYYPEELPDNEEEDEEEILACLEIVAVKADAEFKKLLGKKFQVESFAPFTIDPKDYPGPCWICDGPHSNCFCPLIDRCPVDQKVGEGYRVVCVCGVEVIDGKCGRGCFRPYGGVEKKVLTKGKKKQKLF